MSAIAPMQPVVDVNWDKVQSVRVTLEAPYKHGKAGKLRFRLGTTEPRKNLAFDADDDSSGPPYWPGEPVMFPEDDAAGVGDSWIMPARDAMTAFGHWYAPREVPKRGIIGFTLSIERERVAAFWNWYKMPPGDGTMHPPMNRLAAPDIPNVSIRPLNRNFQPLKDKDGKEIVINPRDFYDFDNPVQYDALPATAAAAVTIEELMGRIDAMQKQLEAQSVKVKPA